MTEYNGHNNIYTAADIQNYLEGKLTPLQMNAMEKAALEDPLLAEAMEGYAGMQTDDWKNTLADLRNGFARQHEGAKVIPLSKNKNNWWKAAAAVLLIGTTAALSYFLINKKENREVAENTTTETKQTPAEAITADSVAVNGYKTDTELKTKDDNIIIAEVKPEKPNNTIVRDVTHAPAATIADSMFVYTPAKQQPAAGIASATGKTAEDEMAKNAASPATANAVPPQQNTFNNTAAESVAKNYGYDNDNYRKEKKSEVVLSDKKEPLLNKTFFAQVLSADNSPLPFANINIKSENFGTYADVKGNFRLLSNDSLLTVEVKAAGYKPQIITLRSNAQQNRVVLSEDNNSFKESTVVTSGNAKSKALKRSSLIKDSVMNVEPADGWDNYNTYADNNIEIPDDILKNNIHGQVELSFDVKANGAITNIKVDKSLCDNCDDAAIRLLQQGPQWKVKKGKKGKGKITVQF